MLDRILKTERGEVFSTEYEPGASDDAPGCSKCPRQGFCGLRALGRDPADGVLSYETLWSDLFCHAGLSRTLELVFRSATFFTPERGIGGPSPNVKHNSILI